MPFPAGGNEESHEFTLVRSGATGRAYRLSGLAGTARIRLDIASIGKMPEKVNTHGGAFQRLAYGLNDGFQQFHCLGLTGVEAATSCAGNALRAESRIYPIQCLS